MFCIVAKFHNCKSIANRVIATLIVFLSVSHDFEQIFDPQGTTGVSYAKGTNFNFRHFWRPFWILAENEQV